MEKLKFSQLALGCMMIIGLILSPLANARTNTLSANHASLLQTDWKPDPGFESLFDGKTLNGWCYRDGEDNVIENFEGKAKSSDGRYSAADGILTVNALPAGAPRKVQKSWTLREFPTNFMMKIEFRASKNEDSGIFLRNPQLQCRDYLVAGPYTDLKKYRPQDWNLIVVTVKDNIAHCECNGEVLEDALKLPATGPLGLEGDRGQMEYRHIQIKALP